MLGGKGILHYKCHDNGEGHEDDEADDDDDDDDDDDGDDDMMRWMLRTRRKMMMLRRMMLKRKTDPKTRPGSTLCASRRSRNAHGHFRISEEPFCVEIYREMPNAYENTSIKHRASTLTVRTPSAWPHCLEKKITCCGCYLTVTKPVIDNRRCGSY